MIKGLISVVMPTYNDDHYIGEALDDILNQTYKDFELLIVDDGSTDNTSQILKQYAAKDSRIKVFRKENGGTGSALNYGFARATGEFGTWVSSDDNKRENYLEVLVSFLEKNRDIEFVCSAFHSAYLKKMLKPYHYSHQQNQFVLCDGLNHDNTTSDKALVADDWAEVNGRQCFLGVCFMFTMRLKNACGDYLTLPGEDYHMTMVMALNSRCAWIDSNLGTHNNPADSLSMQDRACVGEANKLTRHLYYNSPRWHLSHIPKVAHFYWGGQKMSFMRYMTIKSFKKFNPSWSVHLYSSDQFTEIATWREADPHHRSDSVDYKLSDNYYNQLLEEVPLKVIKVDFSKTPVGNTASEVHKSDFIRWNLLYSHGGLWCDMDIIFHRSLSDLSLNTHLNQEVDSVVCYDKRNANEAPIGFLMSSKGNVVFKSLAKLASTRYDKLAYQSIGTQLFNSLGRNFEDFKRNFINRIHNLETKEVYSLDHKNINRIFEQDCYEEIKDSSIGVHWYGGAPLTQQYNNQLTLATYEDFDNTFTTIAKIVLNS